LRWIGFSEDDAKINRPVIAGGRKILLPEHRAHEKAGGEAAFTFSNVLRTTRSTYCSMPKQSLRLAVPKKSKISLDVFLAFQLKRALLRRANRVKAKNRQKIKKVFARFWRFR